VHIKGKGSPWTHSELFFEVDVAFKWNLTPDEFWEKPPFIQAVMAAYTVGTSKMGRIG